MKLIITISTWLQQLKVFKKKPTPVTIIKIKAILITDKLNQENLNWYKQVEHSTAIKCSYHAQSKFEKFWFAFAPQLVKGVKLGTFCIKKDQKNGWFCHLPRKQFQRALFFSARSEFCSENILASSLVTLLRSCSSLLCEHKQIHHEKHNGEQQEEIWDYMKIHWWDHQSLCIFSHTSPEADVTSSTFHALPEL